MKAPTTTTFYKRVLPPSCTAFSSKRGKEVFASAMQHHGLKSFFALMEQHTTQTEPSFCGISTLVVALNAFAVDPKQSWKGPWRWYHEDMLNCCLDLEDVKKTGITLANFACLAVCQGVSLDLRYAQSKEGSIEEFRAAVTRVCVDDHDDPSGSDENANTTDNNEDDKVRDILIASYDRKTLGQTGSGHFSPIAAYDSVSDSVLILDTARFKYGAHWVPLPLLHSAMLPKDPDTGKSRGFVILSLRKEEIEERNMMDAEMPVSILFRYKFNETAKKLLADFHSFLIARSQNVTWEDVYCYWTKREGPHPSLIWQAIEPQYKPLDQETTDLVTQVLDLIRQLMPPTLHTSGDDDLLLSTPKCIAGNRCGPNNSRTLPLGPDEAIYIVFLSTMLKEERRSKISAAGGSQIAQEQLLAAADLMEKAILLAGGGPSPS